MVSHLTNFFNSGYLSIAWVFQYIYDRELKLIYLKIFKRSIKVISLLSRGPLSEPVSLEGPDRRLGFDKSTATSQDARRVITDLPPGSIKILEQKSKDPHILPARSHPETSYATIHLKPSTVYLLIYHLSREQDGFLHHIRHTRSAHRPPFRSQFKIA